MRLQARFRHGTIFRHRVHPVQFRGTSDGPAAKAVVPADPTHPPSDSTVHQPTHEAQRHGGIQGVDCVVDQQERNRLHHLD